MKSNKWVKILMVATLLFVAVIFIIKLAGDSEPIFATEQTKETNIDINDANDNTQNQYNSITKNNIALSSLSIHQDFIVKAESQADFNQIQYKDFTFGHPIVNDILFSDSREGNLILSDEKTNRTVEVAIDIYKKYSLAHLIEMLFAVNHPTGQESELIEAAKQFYSVVYNDPWESLYGEVHQKNIDTTGKSFLQVWQEAYHYPIYSEDQVLIVYRAEQFGMNTEAKSFQTIKEEVMKFDETIRLIEESKDMAFDPNWLIEEEKWWLSK
ncbi:hypothetical protein [Chengkuizengella axinellae]|uniref:Uncharacterized protein n=1 Tax=Chengkuizengella axinellae TaxID=3064388 RepID=A0ABT9J2Z4_9BACL|nr:hypothetical protein [Chengkuizengella sp. 2205SS18-9]MDP5275963.1 hypothetical protein [Chengkuizengella sp. 2205SS18-9]